MELRPGYKQTEVGVIPEDWQVKSFSELGESLIGLTYRASDVHSDGILVLRSSNIQGGSLRFDDNVFVACPVPEKLMVKSGDILICVRNGSRDLIGKCAHLDDRMLGMTFGAFMTVFRSNAHNFVYQQMQSQLVKRQIQEYLGATINQITNKSLNSFDIPLPPTKAEQQTIAEALSDADALIESLEQLLVKKRQIKQGAMQELLTVKKRLPGFTAKWDVKPLGDVILHCSSGATPYRGQPEYYKGNVKWISSGELNYNVIEDTIEHISAEAVRRTNLKVHPAGTFLMAITGLEAEGTRGACAIVGSPATTNQSCMAIYPSDELSPAFLYHSYVFRGKALAMEYCQGTKQQSYTAKLVKLLPINLPPTVEEQIAISAVLSDLDADIEALEAKLTKGRQLKQGMMQELLTGRIRLI